MPKVSPCQVSGRPFPERVRGLAVAADRALHDLREKAEEQRQPAQVAVRAGLLPRYTSIR